MKGGVEMRADGSMYADIPITVVCSNPHEIIGRQVENPVDPPGYHSVAEFAKGVAKGEAVLGKGEHLYQLNGGALHEVF